MKYRAYINENEIIYFTFSDIVKSYFENSKTTEENIKVIHLMSWLKNNEPDIHVGYISDGKEYYTGDIIRMEIENDKQEKIAEEINVVVWNDDIKCVEYAPSPKHRGLTIRDFFKRYKNCQYVIYKEILGNIHDGKYQFKEEENSNCCDGES
jgi:hypothetical protein